MTLRVTDLNTSGYERVVHATNNTTKLDSIIAIHNTKLGPSLGGIRFWEYDSFDDQLTDVLRLAECMTYKNSLCGIDFGGGKSAINGKGIEKTTDLYLSFAEAVDHLGGEYISAGDVGTTNDDLKNMSSVTNFVAGYIEPSAPHTAFGVYIAIKAVRDFMQGESDSSLDGLHIAVSGLGKVGFDLSKLLYDEGVRLTVADIDNQAVIRAFRDIDAADVESDICHEVYCDIFSPCALGNVINKNTRESLQCTAIVGAANNQLDNEDTADWLRKNNIVYAPDYLVNSGGVIATAFEITNNIENIQNQVLEIYDRTYNILEMSKKDSLSTYVASKNIAMDRINSV